MWKLAALGVVDTVMVLWLELQVHLDCIAMSPEFFEAVQLLTPDVVRHFNAVIVFSSLQVASVGGVGEVVSSTHSLTISEVKKSSFPLPLRYVTSHAKTFLVEIVRTLNGTASKLVTNA